MKKYKVMYRNNKLIAIVDSLEKLNWLLFGLANNGKKYKVIEI